MKVKTGLDFTFSIYKIESIQNYKKIVFFKDFFRKTKNYFLIYKINNFLYSFDYSLQFELILKMYYQ